MSKSTNKKKRNRWSPFSRLFIKKTKQELETSAPTRKLGVEDRFEDSFIIEDSDVSDTELKKGIEY